MQKLSVELPYVYKRYVIMVCWFCSFLYASTQSQKGDMQTSKALFKQTAVAQKYYIYLKRRLLQAKDIPSPTNKCLYKKVILCINFRQLSQADM